jgi:hypothetical protein
VIKIAPPKKGFNEYKIINDKYAEFYIDSPKYGHKVCFIDLEDLPRLIEFGQRWHIRRGWDRPSVQTCVYGRDENGKYKIMYQPYLSRFIMGLDYKTDMRVVDHEDHNPYDNRKENLRITTDDLNLKHRKSKNSNNTSGYRNVSYNKRSADWMVQLQDNKKNHVWRGFKTPEEANEFAKIKRKELYGEFAGED